LDEAGIETDTTSVESTSKGKGKRKKGEQEPGRSEMTKMEELEKELQTAIETENYEKAAKIRDKIQKLKG
jgi:protein-arginine kinase activator protein McsA